MLCGNNESPRTSKMVAIGVKCAHSHSHPTMPDHNQRPFHKQYIDVNGYQALTKCDRCTAIGTRHCNFLLRADIQSRSDMKRLYKCSKCTKDSQPCFVERTNVLHAKEREFGNRNRAGNEEPRIVKSQSGRSNITTTNRNPVPAGSGRPARHPVAEIPVNLPTPVLPALLPIPPPTISVPEPLGTIPASTSSAPSRLSPHQRLKLVQQTQRLLQNEVRNIIIELESSNVRQDSRRS
jgi:hypothetical protein